MALLGTRYTGLPPTGEWVLNIYDGSVDGLKGHLYEWGITMNLVPCNREYSWTQLGASTASNRPPARHDATGVVVGHSWFIWGGMTHTKLEDMWRFDLGACAREVSAAGGCFSHSTQPKLASGGLISIWFMHCRHRHLDAVDHGSSTVTRAGAGSGGRAVTLGCCHMGRAQHWLTPFGTAEHISGNSRSLCVVPNATPFNAIAVACTSYTQWDVIDAQWVAVRPPPASDPRLHEAGVFLDPNYNLNDEHLVRDFSFSALKALQTEVPTFPPRRMLHAMALFGVRGTESYRRGVKQPRIFVFGGCVRASPSPIVASHGPVHNSLLLR